jgi:hypothetical protein
MPTEDAIPAPGAEFSVILRTCINLRFCHQRLTLQVPKREIFVTELFTLSDSICIGDLRIEPKNSFV